MIVLFFSPVISVGLIFLFGSWLEKQQALLEFCPLIDGSSSVEQPTTHCTTNNTAASQPAKNCLHMCVSGLELVGSLVAVIACFSCSCFFLF